MVIHQPDESRSRIYTIGHSTRKIEDFITMLLSFQINVLADVRNYPGSRWFPHFNKARLQTELDRHGIAYLHLKELGGRKDARETTISTTPTAKKRSNQNAAFAGYAAYMKTDAYKTAEQELETLANEKRVAFMCAEADWRKCHRSLMADSLKQKGWDVRHITGVEQSEPHAVTPYANAGGKLF